jgi:hypothetical protein
MLRWFQSHSIFIDLAVASTLALTLLVALQKAGLPQTSQTTFDHQFELHSGQTVGQSFVGEASGLYRLDVLVARRGPTPYPLLFHLKEEEAPGDHVVTVELDASLLQDTSSMIRRPNSYQSFTFDPVQDSRGKRLYFYLEAPLSTPEYPLVLRFQSHDAYGEGTRCVNGVEDCGDLAFKAYYRDTPLATATMLLRRLTEGKPTPLSLDVCYPIAAFAYLLTFARLARLLLAFWFNLSRQQ